MIIVVSNSYKYEKIINLLGRSSVAVNPGASVLKKMLLYNIVQLLNQFSMKLAKISLYRNNWIAEGMG